jgi:hypothetical protein
LFRQTSVSRTSETGSSDPSQGNKNISHECIL